MEKVDVLEGEAKGMEIGKQGGEVRLKTGRGAQTNDSFIKQAFSRLRTGGGRQFKVLARAGILSWVSLPTRKPAKGKVAQKLVKCTCLQASVTAQKGSGSHGELFPNGFGTRFQLSFQSQCSVLKREAGPKGGRDQGGRNQH